MDGLARYTAADLQVYTLRSLIAKSGEIGIDPDRLCGGLGFDVADLSNPGCRLSFRQGCAMIRRAVELTPGRALGLEVGLSESVSSTGMVGYAMLTSPTLGKAVTLGMKMQHHAGAMLTFDLAQSDSAISIHAMMSRFHDRCIETFLVEEAFGCFLKIARALVGDDFKPTAIDVVYPKPSYASEYDRIFGCPIRYEQKDNLFVCDTDWANRPIKTHDPLSHRQALEFLSAVDTKANPEVDLLESIERMVRRDLGKVSTLAQISAQLCMSERTMRRRLSECGVSYQVMLDSIRYKRALALLSNPRLSTDEVAVELGYCDSRTFRRAFRRWTGRSPRESG